MTRRRWSSPLSQKECAGLFKALADETRLKILRLLFIGPQCVGELEAALALGQSHVSHHLKVLKTAGLLEAWRDGHKMCYALHPQVREQLSQTKQERLDLGCCEVTFTR